MRILIAEDDTEMAGFAAHGLRKLGHHVTVTNNGLDALRIGLHDAHDVLVLDRMLPGRDGLTVLRALRARKIRAPVIFLTALGQTEDRVEGIDAGADEYLVKPITFSELSARIQALAGRTHGSETTQTELSWGPIHIDLMSRLVSRDGEQVGLQPREYRLLEALMRSEGRVVTCTMLLEHVWSFHFVPQTNIVESHMSRLRAKLSAGARVDLIESVCDTGYRMRRL